MIPLYKPYMPELPELSSILYSGSLAAGDYTKKFEESLSSYIGNNTPCITINNSTIAIYIALQSLGIKPGDEVIASPIGCLVSTQPLVTYGLKVVWADIDPNTGTLLPESVKSVITPKTKAIIHNHFCGYVGYIDEIKDIAKNYGLFVIDDCIEAFGSEYKGRKIGNDTADVSVFNFGAVRIPNTIDGAALTFRSKTIYEKALVICDSGINRKLFRNEIGEINPECDIKEKGYNAKMSNINSYIGLQQMKHVSDLLKKQYTNAIKWKKKLGSEYKFVDNIDGNPNYWVFGILSENKKEDILKFRNMGYYASGVHINNNLYTLFGKTKTLPNVKKFMDTFIALPCGWWIDNL